jgi:hypothetical protein
MAFDQATLIAVVPVGSDLSARQFQFVSVNSSGQLAVTADAAAADGILLDNHADAAGKPGSMAIAGVCRVAAGGTITAGDYLDVTSGKAVTHASGKIVGKALVSAVSGDIFTALFLRGAGA